MRAIKLQNAITGLYPFVFYILFSVLLIIVIVTPGTLTDWYEESSSPPVPFWFPQTREDNNAFFTNHNQFVLNATATETNDVQPMWDELVVELRKLPHLCVHPFASPKSPTIGSRKPG